MALSPARRRRNTLRPTARPLPLYKVFSSNSSPCNLAPISKLLAISAGNAGSCPLQLLKSGNDETAKNMLQQYTLPKQCTHLFGFLEFLSEFLFFVLSRDCTSHGAIYATETGSVYSDSNTQQPIQQDRATACTSPVLVKHCQSFETDPCKSWRQGLAYS